MTWVEQSVGSAALAVSGAQAATDADDVALKVYLYGRRPKRHGWYVTDPEEHHRDSHPWFDDRVKGTSMKYDLPDVIRVESDGPGASSI